MSAPAGHFFPSPVGGAPFNFDFAPSVVLAVLYGTLAPLIIYRAASPKSRNVFLIGCVIFGLERTVDFAVRALEARNPSDRVNHEIVTYMQTTYAGGFISMGQTLLGLTRVMLVHAAREHAASASDPFASADRDAEGRPLTAEPGEAFELKKPAEAEADPRTARRVRVIMGVTFAAELTYWTAFAFGIISGTFYFQAITDPAKAQLVQTLRYLGSGTALCLLQFTIVLALIAWMRYPRIPRTHVLFICFNAALLSTVAVYRLVVMRFQTDALDSTAPGSLNDSGSKATFYIFHVVPEMLSVVLIFGFNVREMFETGPFGRGR
ncbi:hypothetical protein POSPLADRAFT_1143658 [Postia placenta MAD-698-R-SB12]|uniref:Uncharacterized protein n=1 Tax=Postia placenta MAD-698-R-SB12 TaxID=670580 RepID=A0A1X6N1N9_9APHY|nr:hypothetical protein POSPLADRAFT_1143658 [Postia placenta MAD-698-R-SB12]OSX62376.1 hypothetical protein POSPLADRAFT_1143658 [Postia placenta MAD-698-R-SB12]